MLKFILYDLTSNDGNLCWSPYTWKVRLALNYLSVDYETVFLDYPDVAPTLKGLGVLPASDLSKTHGALYTIPAVMFPDNVCVMNSENIMTRLEAELVDHTGSKLLQCSSPITNGILDILDRLNVAFQPNFMNKIPGILNERSREYFERTRSEAYGMSMAELESSRGGEGPWQAARPALDSIVTNLKQNGGPFLLGEQVCYGDFVLVAYLHFHRRVNEAMWKRLLAYDKSLESLYRACESWLMMKQT